MADRRDDQSGENRHREAQSWKRRQFLQRLGVLGAGVAIADRILLHPDAQVNAGEPDETISLQAGEIPRRKLGRTGVEVSALTLGGFHIGVPKDEQEAIRIIQEALDAGVTFLDNAWEYNEGVSEERMGKALQGRRDKAFLMTKVCTHGRDRKVAMQQLEQSLRRLKTDYIDLWQVHEVVYDNDPERHFAKGGVIEALDEAKRQGKVRFVGFTGHKDPAIHLKMLSYNYPFDAVQLPLNCFDSSFRSFEKQVLPLLNKRGIAAIGMKSLGGSGEPVKAGVVTVQEALRYAMSLPVATTVSGIDSLQVLRQNLNIARSFTPMKEAEMQAMRSRYASYAADGRFELYKTSKKYDGSPGREQHGFPSQEELEA
ncbi:aldo/keto reductase [Funiculus sociatus GB2-A5]|uniref:Aldo/keto reductase n=1 Tax=Funiculus sociatus GB2-A5 TaxID=2933946 RepID=A0ABV0JP79_9CYAN|nr:MULTISPECIES: aldo/keto reductase [unclassified Trichocoleus]MBD1907902.1 aldo/keto reductase [Trichocoleus sp. FACHB-832]MBD2064761.1 aldo/keto reductase [Trichocoleus sp. FACHB-6]